MYTVTRTRRGNSQPVLMQDDGNDYHICLLRFGDTSKVTSSLVIARDPQGIPTTNPILESVIVGPLPLSTCHRLALDAAQKGRGFLSKREKLESDVRIMNTAH